MDCVFIVSNRLCSLYLFPLRPPSGFQYLVDRYLFLLAWRYTFYSYTQGIEAQIPAFTLWLLFMGGFHHEFLFVNPVDRGSWSRILYEIRFFFSSLSFREKKEEDLYRNKVLRLQLCCKSYGRIICEEHIRHTKNMLHPTVSLRQRPKIYVIWPLFFLAVRYVLAYKAIYGKRLDRNNAMYILSVKNILTRKTSICI